ncbi:inositol monophosphatase family protein [Nocardioides sp. WG-D5]|uniref:inositol monophosphatase family protein n=1 Tax=Nocardioides luteus TaxID=1844 RepID=UPI001A2107DE|nr:inositol monophosphatase family protein [Nocardioides luteus]MBG6097739.1 fructose-1,6-bisphosphatase/inositol monophosphatase family enzyme [Nocardioides luteus]
MTQWKTMDEILAARTRFETAIDGWTPPQAHGVGLRPSTATTHEPEHFPLVNAYGHRFPAVVIATVVGHTSGTAAYRMTREQLERAIELISPAEAYVDYDHPNLWSWRDRILPALTEDPEAEVVAVFIGDEPEESPDPAIDAFRRAFPDEAVAIAAATAGAAVVREMYGTDLSHFDKSPTDFATEADIASEKAIRETIATYRPEDAFEGEETGRTGDSERRWLVDPLCGTLNYAAQTPLAAVNVALVTPDGVTAAVSADPISEEIFWTDGVSARIRKGGGDTVLAPTPRTRLVDVQCDGPLDRPFVGGQLVADPRLRAEFGPRVMSSTLAVAWVAAGRRAAYVTDGHLEGSVHFTAGIALCQAAGCVVTDLNGDPIHTGRGMIAAADADTHRKLLGLVRRHLDPADRP